MKYSEAVVRPIPVLPAASYHALLHAVAEQAEDLMTAWESLAASTSRYDSAVSRSEGKALLSYLFRHFADLGTNTVAFVQGFVTKASGLTARWTAANTILVLLDFEEILLSVTRHTDPEDPELVYHWLHSMTGRLVEAVLSREQDGRMHPRSNPIQPSLSGFIHSDRSAYDHFLMFDEHLLAAQDASEVFQSVVRDSCEIGGFQRSALFLYNPLTQTVEGFYAHNIELAEVRRIRESGRRVPMLHDVMRLRKPIYIEDVASVLPKQYIKHFQLSSLLVCPVRGPDHQSVGFLLMDDGGKPFPESAVRTERLGWMMNRVTMALGLHLQSTRLSAQSPRKMLTDRELDILRLIADGSGTKAIALQLHISEYTVTEHVTSIMRKLQVQNRAAAVAKGIRSGLIR